MSDLTEQDVPEMLENLERTNPVFAANIGSFITVLSNRIEELESRETVHEDLAFEAYCAGYESGNHDAVEGCYSPPKDYPEEWPERRGELLASLFRLPKEDNGK